MFRFEVNYWNQFTTEPSVEKGFVCASDYGEAANKVIEYYGKDSVVDIKLCELEDVLTDDDIFEETKGEKE